MRAAHTQSKGGRVGLFKHRIRGLAAAIALVSAGCGGPQTRPSEPPPQSQPASAEPAAAEPAEAPSEGPRALKHESMQSVTEEISTSVQGGLAGAGAQTDFASIAANAQKIQDGADAILEDAPATLKDEDRVRYEGLKAQLKERAAALKTAADAKDKNGTNRSYLQLSRSCNQCHSQFGAGEGK